MKVRNVVTMFIATLLVVALTVSADAQGRRGGGQGGRGQGGRGGQMMGRGGPGGGTMSLLQLAGIEAIQKEIEALDDQVEKINKLNEAQRAQRGERPDTQGMSEEERTKLFEKMQKEREKRAAEGDKKLAEFMLPHQMERLEQVRVQMLGTRALQDAKVAAALKITAKQKADLEKLSTQTREKMMEMFRSGDRENMREKMTELRETIEKDTMAVLTDAQKKEFEEMKGDPIDREQLFGAVGEVEVAVEAAVEVALKAAKVAAIDRNANSVPASNAKPLT